jgi:hypothetical protein
LLIMIPIMMVVWALKVNSKEIKLCSPCVHQNKKG